MRLHDDFALVLVTADDGSTYRYVYGTGSYRSGADVVRAVGRGLGCDELVAQDLHHFLVALYHYDQGEPPHMDPDGDGRPCEETFSAEEVAASWS